MIWNSTACRDQDAFHSNDMLRVKGSLVASRDFHVIQGIVI